MASRAERRKNQRARVHALVMELLHDHGYVTFDQVMAEIEDRFLPNRQPSRARVNQLIRGLPITRQKNRTQGSFFVLAL